MAYLDRFKVGDSVWDIRFGWGVVTKIKYRLIPTFSVKFLNGKFDNFTFDGKPNNCSNQTLFRDEVKFETPEKSKIELKENKFLICLNDNDVDDDEEFKDARISDYTNENGLFRNDRGTAEIALRQIKRYTRLLALRDQECPNSRGFVFERSRERKWRISFDIVDKNYFTTGDAVGRTFDVYFRTEEDAQKICDILNSGRFDLEGE